jgi:hypothetical protein
MEQRVLIAHKPTKPAPCRASENPVRAHAPGKWCLHSKRNRGSGTAQGHGYNHPSRRGREAAADVDSFSAATSFAGELEADVVNQVGALSASVRWSCFFDEPFLD